MNEKYSDGGPAFPFTPALQQRMSDGTWDQSYDSGDPGMSLRTYAAIKLRVPNSGIDWLDDMIRQAKRDEFAGTALQGVLTCEQTHPKTSQSSSEELATCAVEIADAMLAELHRPTETVSI